MSSFFRDFEHLLLNQPAISFLFGMLVYLPLMTILFILWMVQTLLSIVFYVISNVIPISDTAKIANASINTEIPSMTDSDRCSVRILQFNAFYILGRFWTRKPMMEDLIRALEPDIISVNEAIRSRIWNFGTVQMISNLWTDTHCDSVVSSAYEQLKEEFAVFMKYSFFWDYVLGELQLALNVLFLLSFFRRWIWRLLLKGNSVWTDAVLLFTGYPVAFGNALIFRGINMLNPDILTLSAYRTANRALFVHPKDHQKRLWIVNTHLTASAQSAYNVEQQQVEQIESILEWMECTVSAHPADALIICGDFNAYPDSKAYRLMENNGFRSCCCEYLGKGQYVTFDSVSWTLAEGIDEEVGKSLVLDYIWIKPLRKGVDLKIEDCQIVGKQYVNLQHRGEDIKVYPSDHYGIIATLSW